VFFANQQHKWAAAEAGGQFSFMALKLNSNGGMTGPCIKFLGKKIRPAILATPHN